MHRRPTRTTVAAAASALVVAMVVSFVALAGPASANVNQTMTMTWTSGATAPTGSVGTTDVAGTQGGFANIGIPWSGTIQNNVGTNRVMANFWNNNATWAGKTTASQTITLDDQTGAYHFSNYTGSTYFPNGRPDLACTGAPNVNDACHWTPNNPHFPSDYPAIYKGCHFTQCSVGTGAPFPITLNSLVSLPSSWKVTLPNAGVGTFDVAYDIWLDRGVSPALPANAAALNQNDGAEIMLWINNHGYGTNGATLTTPITPAGTKLGTYIDSAGGGWDVWVGRQDPNGARPWNIVSYVKQTPTTDFELDAKQFLDDSLTWNGSARPALASQLNGICPAQNDGTVLGECVSPSWWLTSVQTGFEVWDLPADGGAAQGGALGTTAFSVKPLSVLANDPNGVTGHVRNGNSPVIHWNDVFTIKYASCPGAGSGTYTLHPGNGATADFTGTLAETPAGSGIYVGTAGPLNPGHDGSTIAVSIPCPGGADSRTVPVFIDPSGHVQTTNGLPVQNATVTVLRSTSGTAAGPFVPAPPANIQPTTNPETTDATGGFRWDVLPGLYEVQATAPGCNTVTTAPLPVPPPQVDLLLKLTCAAGAPGVVLPGGTTTIPTGLPVTVNVRAPGIQPWGYCADITVTNNTGAAVAWNTSFPVPGNYHINQAWNLAYTQVGNQATNVHADPNNPWNKILQPGQSTTSTGFCAVP